MRALICFDCFGVIFMTMIFTSFVRSLEFNCSVLFSECCSYPRISPRRRFASVIAKSYPIRTVIQFSRYNEKVLHLFPLGSAELSGVFEKIFLFCKSPLHLFGIERLKRTLFLRKKEKKLLANMGEHTFNTKNIIGLLKYSERIHIG